MTELTHVFDATPENFQQLAVENSRKGVVLVNFWAPRVGPCLKLWQALEALCQEYQGRFLLVNVNTETQKRLVRENGITSVPTVKIYQQGKVVESIHGAQSEASLRSIINKYIPALQAPEKVAAIRSYQAGKPDEALKILAEACLQRPDDRDLHATAMKLLLRENRLEDIQRYHAVLPDSVRDHGEITALNTHAMMLQMARQALPAAELDKHLLDHPGDLDAALQRASIALVQDDVELALEYLFHVFQEDRHYQQGFAHKALLAMFSLLGSTHELTRTFQQRMREILH